MLICPTSPRLIVDGDVDCHRIEPISGGQFTVGIVCGTTTKRLNWKVIEIGYLYGIISTSRPIEH